MIKGSTYYRIPGSYNNVGYEFKKNDYDYPLKNFDIDYWKRTSSSQYLDGGIYGKLGDSWLSKSNLK